jgi:drug/metabolite transporter (DMT)-like permease
VTAGWALLGERVTTQMAIGGAVIVASVALVIRARATRHPARERTR